MPKAEEAKVSNTQKNGIPERVWQSVKMDERLSVMEIGEHLTYAELGEVIGVKDVRKKSWILLASRRRMLREHGIVFDTVRCFGICRVDGSGKVQLNTENLRRLGKKARHIKAVSRSVTAEEWIRMTTDEKIINMTQAARADAIIDAAKPEKKKALPLGGTPPELPPWAQHDEGDDNSSHPQELE